MKKGWASDTVLINVGCDNGKATGDTDGTWNQIMVWSGIEEEDNR